MCILRGDTCCVFGELIGVDGLWFWGMIGVNKVVVLGNCAVMVVGKAMATPSSINIFILKRVYFGEAYV